MELDQFVEALAAMSGLAIRANARSIRSRGDSGSHPLDWSQPLEVSPISSPEAADAVRRAVSRVLDAARRADMRSDDPDVMCVARRAGEIARALVTAGV